MEEHGLLDEDDVGNDAVETIPGKLLPEMNECFRLFPKRPILNALVQLFFQNVNWIYEMMHPGFFLGRYEKWWRSVPGSTTKSLHFSILILRICSYSAQFFPVSAGEAGADGGTELLGVPVDKIRGHCHELASRLQRLCEQLSGPKSLVWVQQLFYAACYEKNEGNMKDAWYILGAAIRVAQDLGLHVENARRRKRSMNDEEYDMGRRVFWNLYIWDRFLALILDRAPCIVDSHCSTDLPKTRFLSPALDAAAPEIFTERMLQAKLSKLWSSLDPGPHYDPVVSEEKYEKLSRSFISQLPRAFHIYAPDTQWDIKQPNLCRQRQTLRIAIFIGLCQIFRPLLRLSVVQVNELLPYKRDLLVQHRGKLVLSAIQVLSSVTQLQQLMGGGPQRFFMLSFCTFESAMLICLHLLTLNGSEQAQAKGSSQSEERLLVRKSVDLSVDEDGISPQTCRQHIEQALQVLQSLQHVNNMAKVGARKLEQVLARLNSTSATSCSPPAAAVPIVSDEVSAEDWLGFEMQQLSETDERHGDRDSVHVLVPGGRHVEDEPWGPKAFSQWIAEEDSVTALWGE